MPVFELSESIHFPSPNLARRDGLLAIGGDLSIERLHAAYSLGIFPWGIYPWNGNGDRIHWFSPDPRLILEPDRFHVSRSLAKLMRKGEYSTTTDRAFRGVITRCASTPRRGESGTWIVPEMIAAYTRMHEAGHAHSVETWRDGELVGGLYGIAIGGAFFGESMFASESNASKIALFALAKRLHERGFRFIDCQQVTPHMKRLGAVPVARKAFLAMLAKSVTLWPRRTSSSVR
jgi:leucyl/phenylalanyl-tRNA--protein transferase